MVGGLGLTFFEPAIRKGQLLVFLFTASLFLMAIVSNRWYGQWILLATAAFNFGLTLVLVACGLLNRYAAPLVALATLAWMTVLARWLDNAFSPGFLSFATMIVMVVVMICMNYFAHDPSFIDLMSD